MRTNNLVFAISTFTLTTDGNIFQRNHHRHYRYEITIAGGTIATPAVHRY